MSDLIRQSSADAKSAATEVQPSGAICDHGCVSASACHGACQPRPPIRTGKRCKWCDMGERLTGDEHWIVESFNPPAIKIRECTAYRLARVESK